MTDANLKLIFGISETKIAMFDILIRHCDRNNLDSISKEDLIEMRNQISEGLKKEFIEENT